MPYGDGYGEDAARHPLHAAAQDGRLADLAVGLCKREATGQLEAALTERNGGLTPLHRAAKCTQPQGAAADGVRLLVAAGADATAKRQSDGYTALHSVALNGPDDPSLAGLLMGAGCDPAAQDYNLWTALDHAKEKNKPRMAALLKAATADPEATLAPFRAEVAALVRLVGERGLEAGLAAILSEPELLASMVREEASDQLGRADKAMAEGTAIYVTGRGRGAYVSFGKKTFGANEHTIAFDSGETAAIKLKGVEWTVKGDEMDAMELAQGNLAEPEPEPDMAAVDLHAAAKGGRLADLGAGLAVKDAEGTLAAALTERDGDGWTPLQCAIQCRQPEGAAAGGGRLLVAAGADATANDEYGYTALHYAASAGPDDPALAGLLMGAGCDPAAKTGAAVIDIAKSNNKPRMAALLEAAAADPEATLTPFRAEFAALRQQGMDYVADVMGRADQALPEGTRICVAARGRGAYVSLTKKTFGANEHTIAFDSGETAAVNLKEVEWTVKEAEMDAIDPLLSITAMTLEQRRISLELSRFLRIEAVKAMIEEKQGIPVGRQRLLLNKLPMEDHLTLEASGVEDGVTISLVMRLEGGPEPEPEPDLAEPAPEPEPAMGIEQRSAAARAAPRWVRSAEAPGCMLCAESFGVLTRKHHCRRCGWAVCASCSEHRLVLDRWLEPDKPHALREDRRSDEPLRVCNMCHRVVCGGAMASSQATPGLEQEPQTEPEPAIPEGVPKAGGGC